MEPTITTTAPAASHVTMILAAVISSLGSIMATWWVANHRAKRRERTTFSQITSDVRRILEQVFPNGGGSMRDCLNRMEEQQLIDGEMRRAYQQHVQVPFWEADPQGCILWSNGAFAKLLGLATEDLKGHGWMGMIHEADLYEVQHRISATVNHDHHMEYRVYRPNKQPLLKLRTLWRRVPNHEGKTVRYVGTVLGHEEIK